MKLRAKVVVPALLVVGVSAPVIASSASATTKPPARITMPDLQIMVPTDAFSIGQNTDTGDTQLQFTHITWNAGAGPFVITPHFNRRTGISTFTQTIYKSRGGTNWSKAYKVNLSTTGIFDPPSDYRYPLTSFTLNQPNSDGTPSSTIVATSPKTDYCITTDFTVWNVPNGPSPPQSDCTKPNKPLGFAVGYGDEYDQTDNGQPIDLTGVPDGTYILRGVVDPEHVLTESNPDNNVVDTELQITGTTVSVLSQTQPVITPPAMVRAIFASDS